MKEKQFTFPITAQDYKDIMSKGTCQKVFHPDDELFIVIVGFKDEIETMRNSEGIKSGLESGINFVNCPISRKILRQIVQSKVGDDVYVARYNHGLSVALVSQPVFNELRNSPRAGAKPARSGEGTSSKG
jgi:hypothetical protein